MNMLKKLINFCFFLTDSTNIDQLFVNVWLNGSRDSSRLFEPSKVLGPELKI